MLFRDRGSFGLPLLRINWARRGLRFYLTSHTWHFWRWSRNIRNDTQQDHFDHPGPGFWEGRRKKR